jgi:hypothetical protein
MKFILYTSLFTKSDQNPENNNYVWLFFSFIWSIYANNVLLNNDHIVVLIDQVTHNYIFKINGLKTLIDAIIPKITFKIMKQPSNVLDGFYERHNPDFIQYLLSLSDSETIFIHSDIDTVFQEPLRSISWTIKTGTFYLLEELENSIFGECYLKNYDPPENDLELFESMKNNIMPTQKGWTAGLFAYTKNSSTLALFKDIYSDQKRALNRPIFFEQAGFVFNILKYFNSNLINIDPSVFIINKTVSYNNFRSDAPIVSLMGEAGDGVFHMDKVCSYWFAHSDKLKTMLKRLGH